ncbi:hypothetical protein BKA70DRAFT_1424795 [Coprinopsis sp. MPI-PUGE-AT-0042]|nr:hypothetical protein BKA70DRAFT_1424795 [Coprinopsis sp. MPI-PUGE-AT-0042]
MIRSPPQPLHLSALLPRRFKSLTGSEQTILTLLFFIPPLPRDLKHILLFHLSPPPGVLLLAAPTFGVLATTFLSPPFPRPSSTTPSFDPLLDAAHPSRMPKAPKAPRTRRAPNVLVGRRSSIMNTEQAIGANEMVDKYAEYADSLSPQLPEKQRTALLGSKFEELFDELFASPAFQNAVVEGDPTRNTAAWFAKLKKKLSNYMSRRDRALRAESASLRTMTTIRRCLLLFRGEFSPRDTKVPSLVGGALLNHVIKLLWTDEKKAEYADQADPTSEDIDINQQLFSSLLAKGLADILTRGLLGTALVKVSVATQNPTGDLTTTIFYEGFDSMTSKAIAHSLLVEDADDWLIEADCIIPRIQPPMPDLPLDNDGLPLWPLINIDETSITQLTSILNHYTDAVWFHAVPCSTANPCFPATEFADDPSKFLDTKKFKIPTSIPPVLDDIFKLARYFESTSRTGVPFHFLSASEIASSHLAARGEGHVLAGAGEEASLAQALGIFEPPEVDAVHKSQPPRLCYGSSTRAHKS